jgi:hypothetical protein
VHASALLVTLLVAGGVLAAAGTSRLRARARRRYVRLLIAPYRTDSAAPEAVVGLFVGLHKRLLQRWWRRLLVGQPSVALEAHLLPGLEARTSRSWPSPPEDKVNAVEAALCLPQHPIRAVRRPARPPPICPALEEALGVHHAPARPRPA